MKPDKLTAAQREKAVTFLREHPVGVLATAGPGGKPRASTIYFSVDDTLRITFTTKQDTEKYENIQRHHAVTLVVFEAASQTAVQLSGEAAIVSDEHAANAIYRGTLDAASRTGMDVVPPIAKIAAGNYVAFEIIPQEVVLSVYGWGDTFADAMHRAARPPGTSDPA